MKEFYLSREEFFGNFREKAKARGITNPVVAAFATTPRGLALLAKLTGEAQDPMNGPTGEDCTLLSPSGPGKTGEYQEAAD
jgi:hypothetical protein